MIHSLSKERIKQIFKNGKRFVSKSAVVIFSNKKDTEGKFSVIVSKKCIRGAVGRNKAKRQIREIVRELLPIDYDILILLQKNNSSFQDLEKTITSIIKNKIK